LESVEQTVSPVSSIANNKIATSQRSSDLRETKPHRSAITTFDVGKPDLELFPFDQWARLLAKSWRRPSIAQVYEGENGGFLPLKKEISLYLHSARGLACAPEQVILTSSTHDAIEVLSQVLLDEGEQVWIEDPAYPSALQAFARAGVRPVPVRVDEEGFSLTQALAKTTRVRLAFMTPSRQYPLGQTMSLARRLALIDWARANNSWLVEDDYDSEYRYRGQPLAPLAARDGFERTIYLGSFSKVMFPALRLSYIVAPNALVKPLLATLQSSGNQASIIAQPALAEFMAAGYFAQHIRRTRRIYAKRHTVLVEALEKYAEDLFELQHYDSGMHVVAHFKPVLTAVMSDIEAALHLRQHNLISTALSQTFQTQPKPQGLLLGFAAVPEKEIGPNVKKLTDVLRMQVG
jgi:GntR family transcriptional regulator / MocR family aminotransferase